ncbi:MAG: T9SS type A sorting domain-containing protein, partial [Chitinophagaceae bacterium]
MKKILLLFVLMASVGMYTNLNAQCNQNTPVVQQTQTIDGDTTDWINILGHYTGDVNNPFNPPASSASNWAVDGIGGVDDRDSPTPPRDLRFFAFTFDLNNVYFYFRRINNNSSQNTYVYFCDIFSQSNTVKFPDGFMNNGEPVFVIDYTNGQQTAAGVQLKRYIVDGVNDFVATKGNYMAAPPGATAPQSPGLSDGYSMQGSFGAITGIPAPTGSEVFAAAVTEDGFGIEFAVPWSYFRLWGATGSLSTPLVSTDLFTYHVSLLNGSSDPSNAQDNAGGCCGGVAVNATASSHLDGSYTGIIGGPPASNTYTVKTKYLNDLAFASKVGIPQLYFFNLLDNSGVALTPAQYQSFTVTVYPDPSCTGSTVGLTANTFAYDHQTVDSFYYVPTGPRPEVPLAASVGASGCFLTTINFGGPALVKNVFLKITSSTDFTFEAGNCDLLTPGDLASPVSFLPVKFSYFNAKRDRQDVGLTWETQTENKNAGFDIERRIGASGWQKIGFVASLAANGTSASSLRYTFTDFNNITKGISQYRLKQIDIDQRSAYSDVRAVRGLGQAGRTIVYPNPSSDGKVNIVFEESNVVRDVQLSDVNGRIMKQWKNVSSNTIQIDNLTPGFYNANIVEARSQI